MGDAAFIAENESKAAKLFAARRLRSEKYSQCGWGTCTEDSESEFQFSDSEESELDFTDNDVPDFVEPLIRSNTPTEPEHKINATGRGAKLFQKRKERMTNYTKTGNGKASGLPTGKALFVNDRQRCGYSAMTKYDRMNQAKLEMQREMDAENARMQQQNKKEEPKKETKEEFIDFTPFKPKKIILPKVEIQKPSGPLPFQYMRPNQFNGGEVKRPFSACGRVCSSPAFGERPETPSGPQRPWNQPVINFKSVAAPVNRVDIGGVQQVAQKPQKSTDFGSVMNNINSANYRKINFKQPKKTAPKLNAGGIPKASNLTALGFRKPLEGRITVTDRRMSVKDMMVKGQDPDSYTRLPPMPKPQRSPRPGSRNRADDSQTRQHLEFIDERETHCPTRPNPMPEIPHYSKFAPRKIVTTNANVWQPQVA